MERKKDGMKNKRDSKTGDREREKSMGRLREDSNRCW